MGGWPLAQASSKRSMMGSSQVNPVVAGWSGASRSADTVDAPGCRIASDYRKSAQRPRREPDDRLRGEPHRFFTVDCDEQDFKAPEEIRKANLCGADLRGAKIDGVDFYLVDLRRDPRPRTAEQLRLAGAILANRATEPPDE